MQPLTFLTGILLGSSASITLGLGVVLLLYAIMGTDQPIIAEELPAVATSFGLFTGLTVVSALGFIGLIRRKPWRWVAQACVWAGWITIGYYYWP